MVSLNAIRIDYELLHVEGFIWKVNGKLSIRGPCGGKCMTRSMGGNKAWIGVILLVGSLLFSSIPVTVSASSDNSSFLLADGTISYAGWEYFRAENDNDPYDIEWAMNITVLTEIDIESRSDSIVEFYKQYTHVVEESYQKRTSIVYSPATYGLRFYDDDWNLLGTKNESLTYELTRQVEKDTGKRTLALNPFGSTIVALAAYYDNPMVYGYTLNYWYNGEPGSYSNVFMPNASVWEIGDEAFTNMTVSAEGTFQGYETWNVQYNQVPPGYSEFYDSTEYEKTSGLVVKVEFRGVMPNEFYWEMKERAIDLGDVIDDGPPVVSAFPAGIVSSMDPIIITFNGTDLHISHYNLYRNDTLIETGTEQKVNWTFELVPTEGNTTYRFEIVDTLGHSTSASLWVLFVPEPDSGIPLGTLAIVGACGAGVVGVLVIVVFLRRSRPSYRE